MFRWSSLTGPAGAALLGGVVGGLVVGSMRPAASKGKPLTVVQEPSAAESSAFEQRLSSLEAQLRAQRPRQLRVVQPGALPTAAPGASAQGNAATDPPAGAAPAPVIDDPVFEAAVRDIVDRVAEERESEREVRSDERRREAAQGWTADFAKRASLSDEQKSKVLSVVQDFLDRLRDLRNADGGTGIPKSRQEWRAQMQQVRDQAEQRLATVLNREQLDAYNKLDEDQRIGAIPRQFFRRPRD